MARSQTNKATNVEIEGGPAKDRGKGKKRETRLFFGQHQTVSPERIVKEMANPNARQKKNV